MKTPRLFALALLVASVACSSCKTTSPPDGGPVTPKPPLTTVIVDCGKTVGGPIVGEEIPKIVTALTSDDVDGGLQKIISEVTAAGFLTTEAFSFVACVVKGELRRSRRDGALGDAAALKRANAADRWLTANGVVFAPADAPPPDGGAARRGRN